MDSAAPGGGRAPGRGFHPLGRRRLRRRSAAELADPGLRVSTRDEVLTAGDYLSAYVLEWTLHHLDLVARLPGMAGPPAEGRARSRETLEKIAHWADMDARA